ncbi:MAG: hypothetical protein CSA65_02225 [Proteobacteria bacterium]|nr:MAG: hypothetical protein CSA65_02225 [Pseudomonadota bacterium]
MANPKTSRRETRQDYANPVRPGPIAWANKLGSAAAQLGLRAPLSAADLLASARRRAGLRDFGGPPFNAPFERLISSIESEAELHPLGRWMIRESLLRVLQNRLRMQRDFGRHREIGAGTIQDPVFIVGLQRTGTTLLQRLLARDPAHRHLASWEAINVAPLDLPRWKAGWQRLRGLGRAPATFAAHGGSQSGHTIDPWRLAHAKLAARSLGYLAPGFFAIHPVEAEAPEEDVLLLAYSFYSTVPEATLHVPSYASWLERQEQVPAYRHHRRLLRYLQWQRPRSLPPLSREPNSSSSATADAALPRWLLKTPHHLEHLDALLEVYPDAKMIMTHRDPIQALASSCTLMAHGRGVFTDVVDPRQIGAQWSRKAQRVMRRALEVRERHPHSFFDVHYHELVRDPLAVLRRLYEAFLERPFHARLEASFTRHLPRNPQHQHGHRLSTLASFGLDEATELACFADYTSRFEIPQEPL